MSKNHKVLIIYPPNQLMDIETPRPDGSLGPLYLASELEKRGIETDILDASVGTEEHDLTNTFYRTVRQENGLIRIVGRVDDVIKVAGHRVTTGELENAIAKHPNITESAVVGIPDEIKGEVPIAFAVPSEALAEEGRENLEKGVVDLIKKTIGPIALPKKVYLVEDLPKTRSGKIMRRILRKLFTKEELGDLSTLANPESVEKIQQIIKK